MGKVVEWHGLGAKVRYIYPALDHIRYHAKQSCTIDGPKTASGYGRSSFARLAYRPVSGERKSGIPAAVLTPAPV